MIEPNEVVWLGVTAGLMGSLVGGMLLGIGMYLVVTGLNWGWLLLLAGVPASALPGWLLAQRLVQRR